MKYNSLLCLVLLIGCTAEVSRPSVAHVHDIDTTSISIAAQLPKNNISAYSPYGLRNVTCALSPIIDAAALNERSPFRQCVTVYGAQNDSAVWVSASIGFPPELQNAVRMNASLFVSFEPLGDQIEKWIDQHGGDGSVLHSNPNFAAVNIMNYSASWVEPFPSRETKRATFFGKHSRSAIQFIVGQPLALLEHRGMCDRVRIPLADKGSVFITSLEGQSQNTALSCLFDNMGSQRSATYVQVVIPKLNSSSVIDLAMPLSHTILRPLFQPTDQSFRSLRSGLALNELRQSLNIHLDEAGVGVKATTIADRMLGFKVISREIKFDHPFLVRISSASGIDLAIICVSDL